MRPASPLRLALVALALLPACGGIADRSSAPAETPDATPPPSPVPTSAPGANEWDASLLSLVDASGIINTGPPPATPCPSPLPGCTSTISCPEGNGESMCTCVGGSLWSCSMPAGPDGGPEPGPNLGLCPANLPEAGASCDAPTDVMCVYSFCWSARCDSDTGGWVRITPCLPSPPPPGP
jgi:hypothetical protein